MSRRKRRASQYLGPPDLLASAAELLVIAPKPAVLNAETVTWIAERDYWLANYTSKRFDRRGGSLKASRAGQ